MFRIAGTTKTNAIYKFNEVTHPSPPPKNQEEPYQNVPKGSVLKILNLAH